MKCPRCQRGEVKRGYRVCGWCMDEVLAGDTKKLKGRGYDLTKTAAIAERSAPFVRSLADDAGG